MRFYVLSPEVAGGLGRDTVMDRSSHPPVVRLLHYELEGWLGDDLIESFPVFLVTERLRDAVSKAELSGASFDVAKVTRSEQFDEMYPGRVLPEFFWLKVSGTPGSDDLGLSPENRLVVSERALQVMKGLNLGNADVESYPS